MSGTEFKAWMKGRDLRVADVASTTNLDTNTVYAFIREESVRRTTKDILIRYAREFDAQREAKAV